MLMMLNSWMQTMMNDVNRRTQVKNEMSYKKMLQFMREGFDQNHETKGSVMKT